MPTFKLFWSPEGRQIATVEAKTMHAAIRKAPQPFRKFLGEIYATEEETNLYDAAVKRMPICLGGFDPLYHKTVADILFMAETELSLYEEGEPETDIKTKQQLRIVKNYIESLRSDCEAKS